MYTPKSARRETQSQQNSLQRVPLSIGVVGASGVGKSCLISRALFSQFKQDYEPTIEETYSTLITSDLSSVLDCNTATMQEDLFELDVIDTGNDITLSEKLLRECDGIIFVCSVDVPNSTIIAEEMFEIVKNFNPDERRANIIVQNKCDLSEDDIVLPKIPGPFIKCSAKTGANVNECLKVLVREIITVQFQISNTLNGADTTRNAIVAKETRTKRELLSPANKMGPRKRDKLMYLLKHGPFDLLRAEYVVDDEHLQKTGEIVLVKKKKISQSVMMISVSDEKNDITQPFEEPNVPLE